MSVPVSEEFRMMAGGINANSAILSFRVSYTLCYHLSEMTRDMSGPCPFFQVLHHVSDLCHSEEHYCPLTRNIDINFH